jgi:hypothetical protein
MIPNLNENCPVSINLDGEECFERNCQGVPGLNLAKARLERALWPDLFYSLELTFVEE